MPRIKEYQIKPEVSGTVDVKAPSFANVEVGRGIQNVGDALMDVAQTIRKKQEQNEVSNLNRQMAEAHSTLTTQWMETLQKGGEFIASGQPDQSGTTSTTGSSPEDGQDMATKFIENLNSHFDKISEGISTDTGRYYFESQRAAQTQHFVEIAKSGQSELAGMQAKQNYIVGRNASASSLMNDPSSFKLMLDQQEATLQNLVKTGGLPAEAAMKLRTETNAELAKSAVRGWIQKDPSPTLENTKKDLDSGRWDNFFDADVKKQLYGEIHNEVSGRSAEMSRQRAEAERIRKEEQMNTQNDFLAKLSGGKLTDREVLKSNLDPFGSGSKEQFIEMIKKNSESRTKTDPGTYQSLFNRIHLADNDPKKIRNENDLNKFFGRGLDMTSLNALRGEVQKRRTPEGEFESNLMKQARKMAESKIVKDPLYGVDPEGQQQMLIFDSWFGKEVMNRKEKGEDPAEFLNPASSKYILSDMSRFQRSGKDIIKSMTAPRGAATPLPPEQQRKDGETPAQYLERMKNKPSANPSPVVEPKAAAANPTTAKKKFTEMDSIKNQLGWTSDDTPSGIAFSSRYNK